ncbi:MAG: HAD family phosphatase [Spirochaetaceae bacterium]|nr:HAD family phosphatase [Spirochaetaceae bacterium]
MNVVTPEGLLATDLDGTLAVEGVIGESERKSAALLRSRGIPILVITGRNPKSLEKVEGLWEVADEVLFSSGAGVLSSKDAQPLGMGRLTAREVAKITFILDAAGEDYCLLDPIPDNHCFSWKRHRQPEDNPDFDRRMGIYNFWGRPKSGVPGAASQILVVLPPGSSLHPDVEAALSPWSVFHSSSPVDHQSLWLEIFPSGMNKGSALAAWCASRGLSKERVLALGNDFNDEAMLSWAGMGRVVEGSPSALKARFPVLPPAGKGGFEAAVKEALENFIECFEPDR